MSLKRVYFTISAALAVIVFSSCEKTNQQPSTPLVVATDTLVTSGSQVMLSATATDPDGDALFWEWHSTGGSFDDSSKASTIWTAPTVSDTQVCSLAVEVSDGNGGKSSADVDVTVIPAGSVGVEVIVGSKSAAGMEPFDGAAFDFYRCQMLYHASLIAHQGRITRLSIMPAAQGSEGIFNNFKIYMAVVSRGELESGFSANYEGQIPQSAYFNPSLSYDGEKDSWFDFNLTTPFDYDTTKNLLVEFIWKVDNGKSVSTYGYQAAADNQSDGSQYEDAEDGLLSGRLLYLKLTFTE